MRQLKSQIPYTIILSLTSLIVSTFSFAQNLEPSNKLYIDIQPCDSQICIYANNRFLYLNRFLSINMLDSIFIQKAYNDTSNATIIDSTKKNFQDTITVIKSYYRNLKLKTYCLIEDEKDKYIKFISINMRGNSDIDSIRILDQNFTTHSTIDSLNKDSKLFSHLASRDIEGELNDIKIRFLIKNVEFDLVFSTFKYLDHIFIYLK